MSSMYGKERYTSSRRRGHRTTTTRFASRRDDDEEEKAKTLLDISNRFKETSSSIPPTTPTSRQSKKQAQTPGAALMSALNELNLSTSKIVSSVSRVRHQKKRTTEDNVKASEDSTSTSPPLPVPLQIRFGTQISLCSEQHFLTVYISAPGRLHADANANADDKDAGFKLINANFRDHTGSLRFGDTVAFAASNGMYVASSRSGGGSGPGLYRRAFGSNEKWTIVRVSPSSSSSSPSEVGTGSKIMLRNDKDGHYLSVRKSKNAAHWKVVAVSRSDLDVQDGEERYCAEWIVLKPHTPATCAKQEEVMQISSSEKKRGGAGGIHTTSLRQYSPALQEHIVIEDLLFALTGVEGQYVRLMTPSERESRVGRSLNHDDDDDGGSGVPSYFFVDRSLSGMDPSLSFLVKRMLSLCDSYYVVSKFVDTHMQYAFGRTVHALCAAMRELLKEYTLLVAQLEHQYRSGHLTLQKMWYFMQPSMSTLTSLATVCVEARDLVGGALLNKVKDVSARGGDERRAELFSFLIERSAAPFLQTLERWIYTGVIDDPYDEFMIQERKDLSKEALNRHFNSRYWNERYTVRKTFVPWFVRDAFGVTANILTTGKYLNVIRECGRPIRCPSAQSITFADRHQYVGIVGKAYEFASDTLLRLVLHESKLLDHLRSIKEFFFLSRGDLFVHFMDTASEELSKDASDIDVAKLESLLKLSLHTASTSTDPNKDNLTCTLERYKLYRHLDAIHSASISSKSNKNIQSSSNSSVISPSDDRSETRRHPLKSPYRRRHRRHGGASNSTASSSSFHNEGVPYERLSGIEAFSFGYKVEWPLTLVLSRQAMIKYQILFRHLFFCKHVELQLCRVWLQMQTTKELEIRAAMGHSYSLRQRMIHFVQNLLYYVSVEVLEQHWHELDKKIRTVKTIDEVMEHHNNFLDTCLKECLLTNQTLHKIVTKLMATCLLFANEMKSFYDGIDISQGKDEEMGSGRSPRVSRVSGVMSWDFSKKNKKKKKRRGRDSKHNDDDENVTIGACEARKSRIEVQSQHIKKHVTQQSYVRMLRGFRDNFDSLLKRFIAALRDETHAEYHLHLANMFTRLNYNHFYSMD